MRNAPGCASRTGGYACCHYADSGAARYTRARVQCRQCAEQTAGHTADFTKEAGTCNHPRYFPAGSIVPAGGFLALRFDSDRLVSATNTGFGLGASGDALYLLDTLAAGSALIDHIQFGLQIADFSLGRIPDGSTNWGLTLPTIGRANIQAFQ